MTEIKTDTIAAISTAISAAGIGIVRISGPLAIETADRLFRAKSGCTLREAKGSTIHYGHIEEGGKILDEVLVSVLRAPATYTREDTVEINCHGGILVLRRVLDAVIRAGARLADPGEFTRRAFLNGRIDPSQAEAVMDLIASENRSAADNALSHLGGAMRRRVESVRALLLEETARIEAALDDPENYDLTGYLPELEQKLRGTYETISGLLATAEEGRIIKEGIATVILGRPNVGKSTLLNLLAGEERAIVTDIAGTTRDILEEKIVLQGVSLRIMDTAGLRETGDTVEKIGVERAYEAASRADLILYMVDGSVPASEEDRKHLRLLQGREVILILNKTDLKQQISESEAESLLPGAHIQRLSAKDGRGMEELGKCIRERFLRGEICANDEVYITNERQKEALSEAAQALQRVLFSMEAGMPEDLYTVDLMDAYAALGRITGEEVGEELIDEIFSRFCMGK